MREQVYPRPYKGLFYHVKEGSESLYRILTRDLVLQLSVIKILLRENRNYAPDTFLLTKVVILKTEAKFKNKNKTPIELIHESKS